MTSISQIINDWAKMQMSLHPIKVEWRSAIIITALIKLLTMLFSAYAAYTFFYNYIIHIIENQQLSSIFSIVVLVFLETITAIFLGKLFKFFLRKKYRLSLFTFFLVSSLYTLSFISSTEGLAQKQSSKIDKTLALKERHEKQLEALNQSQVKQIQEVDTLISSIRNNPVVWSNRKRKHLSLEQQENILQLNMQKQGIRKSFEARKKQSKVDFAHEINMNQQLMAKSANKYYQVMAIAMIIQFAFTGILIFLLHRVHLQENKQQILNENLKAIRDKIFQQASDFVQQGLQEAVNGFFQQSPGTKSSNKAIQINVAENMGASTDKWPVPNNTEKTPEQLTDKNENMNTETHKRYCEKHKSIVQVILSTVNLNQQFLTKEDIKTKILPLLNGERYKSASLIRKVFKSIKIAGINK